MRVRVAVAFILLAACAGGERGNPVARPSTLAVVPPGPEVPGYCAKLSGGWGDATWDDGRATELWVERIEPSCDATVIYSWGPSPGSQIAAQAGWRRVPAKIDRSGKLTCQLTEFGAEAEYEPADDALKGRFKNRFGNQYVTTLRKL